MHCKYFLLKLPDSTVDMIRYHAMIMLLIINKWIEQSGYKNCRARK